MKKVLLTLMACVLTLGLWADTSVTENYVTNHLAGSASSSRVSFNGKYSQWYYRNARSGGGNDKLNDNTKGFWLSRASGNSCYLESTLEGGIKKVDFKWRQFGTGDNGFKFVLNINVDGANKDQISFDGSDSYYNTDQSYSNSLAIKSNSKLTLQNLSTQSDGTTAGGRFIIGPITITPYLLYTQKEITIGSKQKGYINEELIDNTGSEGTITYSSSAVGVATVDEEGVITPVSAGDAIITATWSEGVTTTYTLHVVDGIIAENFSKVVQTGQTTAATWHGDLWDWSVANVRRGVDDTIGIAPRIQATALRSTAGSTIISNEVVEGGVKHIAFDWRQWASGSGNLNMKMYYSADNTSWGEAVASQSVAAVGAAEPHEFNEDIDDGAKGNAYLKLEYTADGGVGILGVMKITPWLLYTTKEATLDARGENALSFKNEDLIDNTEDDVEYSITDFGDIDEEKIAIAADGTVTVADRYQTGDITVQAKWSEVTTTYTLHVIGKASANAYFVNDEETKTLLDLVFNNPVVKATGAGDATYASGNTDVATVDGANVTIVGVGDAVITATIAENDNFQGAVVSYTLHVTAPNFYIAGDFTSWATNKIPVYADSYTKNLEAGSYELKVIDGETWKGFSDLTEEEVIAGLYGNNDNNVCFTLADDGDVTITYDGEVFKLEGDFTPQVVEFGGSWTSDWGDGKITATLAADKKSATAVKSFTLDDDPNNNWYNFKPIINYSWLGCSAGATGVTRSSLTVSGFTTEDNNNHIYFQADKEGEYKFTWVFGSNTFVFTFPATTPTAIDETDVKAKAVKLIENGMLIIEKNGVRYNVMGQAL